MTNVCGLGFKLTNDRIAHLKCRFSDGHNAVVVSAIYIDEFQLRCTVPDFSRFAVGLPHTVMVEVSHTRGAQWSDNRATFT